MSKTLLQILAVVWNRVVPSWLMRYRASRIFHFPLESVPGDPTGDRSGNLRIDWAKTEPELEVAAKTAKNPLEPADRVGHRAAVVWMDGDPVAAVWIATDHFFERELGLRFALPPHAVWIYCAHVARQHRNQGIYRALLGHVLSQLATQGCTSAFAAVNPVNRDSMRSHLHFGKPIGTVTACRLFAIACGRAKGSPRIDRHWTWNCYYRPLAVFLPPDPGADASLPGASERRSPRGSSTAPGRSERGDTHRA